MKKQISIYYDEQGDFLELNIGKPRQGFSRDIGKDIFERIDKKTGKIIGFGIINFKKRFSKQKNVTFPLDITSVSHK